MKFPAIIRGLNEIKKRFLCQRDRNKKTVHLFFGGAIRKQKFLLMGKMQVIIRAVIPLLILRLLFFAFG
jgi:hypothetical protein